MRVLKVKAVAEKLDIHPNTVYVWVKEHEFPKSFQVGGIPVWDEAEIDAWLQQQKEKRDGRSSRETESETAGADV